MKICWDNLSNKSRSKIKDLTGERFGRLKVLEFAYVENNRAHWKCICDCGNNHIVCSLELKSGDTKSCGCLHKETSAYNINKFRKEHCGMFGENNLFYKHGLTKTKAYICNKTQKRRAKKLNQTPDSANLQKIQLYYTICAYLNKPCEIPMWHVDHIKPISKGGLHHEDNLQILTAAINLQKSDKYPLTDAEQVLYKGVII